LCSEPEPGEEPLVLALHVLGPEALAEAPDGGAHRGLVGHDIGRDGRLLKLKGVPKQKENTTYIQSVLMNFSTSAPIKTAQ
jgi:hypothetical protein